MLALAGTSSIQLIKYRLTSVFTSIFPSYLQLFFLLLNSKFKNFPITVCYLKLETFLITILISCLL